MPYAYTDDCAVYYEFRGDSGSTVMLIAGIGASLMSWYEPAVEKLAQHHRLILCDNRGIGKSGKPNRPYSMELFSDDVATIMRSADISAAHVMGASMGGMIAQNFALKYPNCVRSLILASSIPASPDNPMVTQPDETVLRTLLAPRSGDPAVDIPKLWPILYSPSFIEERRDVLEALLHERPDYPDAPQYARDHQARAVAETHDVLDRLGEITQPTLVMTGSADILIPPENSHLLAERIPNARLVEYEGAGHAFFVEAGDQAVADVVRFLAEVDAAHAVP